MITKHILSAAPPSDGGHSHCHIGFARNSLPTGIVATVVLIKPKKCRRESWRPFQCSAGGCRSHRCPRSVIRRSSNPRRPASYSRSHHRPRKCRSGGQKIRLYSLRQRRTTGGPNSTPWNSFFSVRAAAGLIRVCK